jgi:hypothetical protein
MCCDISPVKTDLSEGCVASIFRMSYLILRGRWFHIIVLNDHVPKWDKIDDDKDSFYEGWNAYSINSLNPI